MKSEEEDMNTLDPDTVELYRMTQKMKEHLKPKQNKMFIVAEQNVKE